MKKKKPSKAERRAVIKKVIEDNRELLEAIGPDGPWVDRLVPLDEVARWPFNPKEHDIESTKASIVRFGFVQPAIYDEKTGRLVAGHGRLVALQELYNEGAPAPKRINVLPDGRWTMPVLRGIEFASEAEAEAYLLADNAIPIAGGWDTDLLSERIRYLSSMGTEVRHIGFSDDAISAILRPDEPDPILPPGEPEIASPGGSLTRPGDVWELGEHRLVCGSEEGAEVLDAVVAFWEEETGCRANRIPSEG